ITAPIEYHAGHIYVASQDGSLYAAQAGRMNNIIWRRPLPAPITAGFGVDDRGCFVPCEDNRIYALNALTGEPLWDPFICEGHLLEPIQVGVSTLFQRAEGDKFYALNLANGRLRWTRPAGRLILAVISGKAYLLDDTGALQVVDEVLGSVSASLPLTGMELFAANTTAPAIYVGNREGYLFCIRPRRAGRLTAQMLEKSGR
ncbi:MAG: PQQ-binding-like beta-propeller repeat protein, partial [Phycisphaerae bacterium]|nr:PQQ-binding-like beta-propeller repeat protein [Phycisphaerae bacterium]